ncbi:maleylpyruvate isomerase family mycothiol-dependent enzyme [Nocardia speluncae]|uniref:Maleylpyruvate isomerase family mycothiol-dependent enzyme n=1 Tax=Nocardia speluncae TaxID=419477 RepID=A0A846XKC0_9NOCA|nr:maleylpyruvate isomerase family mycothiol-dependent enzyme [Nocardia speluncae]NKY36452.1 maleylpyruvate isomerase family mycothiol-dependent enzyme [Nocardia speluncae]
MDVRALARDEREELADLVATLSVGEWNQPSLCASWRVREVVAHVLAYGQLTPRRAAAQLAQGQFLEAINATGVAKYSSSTPERLAGLIRLNLQPIGLTAGFGGRVALVEAMIHQQDIRRPLGLPRSIPPRRLHVALSFTRYAPLIRGAWGTRGVRLEASDLAWAHGTGPIVTGPGESLLMAMAGRPAALDDLSGPGKPRLARLLTQRYE